jgi:hypothetical protein
VCSILLENPRILKKRKKSRVEVLKGGEGRREMGALCTLHKTDTKSKTQYN